MKIVIIGDGKVGHKLTIQLSEENYDVVLIDQNEGKLKEALNQLDILCITGDAKASHAGRRLSAPSICSIRITMKRAVSAKSMPVVLKGSMLPISAPMMLRIIQ